MGGIGLAACDICAAGLGVGSERYGRIGCADCGDGAADLGGGVVGRVGA